MEAAKLKDKNSNTIAIVYSGSSGSTYRIDRYEPSDDIVDIDADFQAVLKALEDKGEAIDNSEMPNNSAYIRRMENSRDVLYLYINGEKVGFMYMLFDNRICDEAISASFVMLTKDVAAQYTMYSMAITKYRLIRMYPHGSVVNDLRSVCTKNSLINFHQKIKPYVEIEYEDCIQQNRSEYSTKDVERILKLDSWMCTDFFTNKIRE